MYEEEMLTNIWNMSHLSYCCSVTYLNCFQSPALYCKTHARPCGFNCGSTCTVLQ